MDDFNVTDLVDKLRIMAANINDTRTDSRAQNTQDDKDIAVLEQSASAIRLLQKRNQELSSLCLNAIQEAVESLRERNKIMLERDQARVELCRKLASEAAEGDSSNPGFHAAARGWSCFENIDANEAMNNLAKLDEELGLTEKTAALSQTKSAGQNLLADTDIVNRLRYFVFSNAAPNLAQEAIEEIEKLRKERNKIENQLADYKECFTDLAKNRDELWEDLERVTKERDKAQSEVAQLLDVETGHRIAIANLTAERDEARRMYCKEETK
jgi:hypothetical protein